jgi:hypothetical protein
MLDNLAPPAEMAADCKPRMPLHNLRVLMHFMHNDLLLASFGATKEVCSPLNMDVQ